MWKLDDSKKFDFRILGMRVCTNSFDDSFRYRKNIRIECVY